jgi:hypothetical protein
LKVDLTNNCPQGQYYCFDDKKCKPMPKGMTVGGDGMLRKEELTHLKQDREHKERDARMKYGKSYKEVLKNMKDKKNKLYSDTRKKGVRFYDKKGSGYMKDGKKTYD